MAESGLRYSHAKVMSKMDYVKRKHRPVLKMESWTRYNYAETFPELVKQSFEKLELIDRRHAELQRHREKLGMLPAEMQDVRLPRGVTWEDTPECRAQHPISQGIDRIHVKDYSIERFIEEYEEPNLPVMIKGVTDNWPAMKKWTFEALARNRYRNVRMKCGEDDDGYSVKVKLKYFLQYIKTQQDDSPLYVFDSSFDEDPIGKELLMDYEIPLYFRDDLFSLVGEKRRPPYRWFLIGPERSGSSVHIDPLGTSAWNTLIEGHKRWILFKPGSVKKLVKGDYLKQKGEDGEAITWFDKVLPRMVREEEKKGKFDSELGIRECIQYPGETIFVPGGWWHAVLNLDNTCACTQNFSSVTNFPKVWMRTRKGRKHMAKRWMDYLRSHYPPLYDAAERLNKQDNFKFVFTKKKRSKKKPGSSKGKSSHKPSEAGEKSLSRPSPKKHKP